MSGNLKWSDNIIRDGFTQDGYIREVPGQHGSLRFKFRPMLAEQAEELEAMRDRLGLKNPADMRAKLAVECQKRLEEWSETFLDGEERKPAPITEANVRKLRISIGTKLYNIIAGIMPSDIEDDDRAEQIRDEFADLAPLESLTESPEERVGK